MPAGRDQLTQRVPMGSVIKCVAFYNRPFWRDQGLSGEAICDRGPVTLVVDDGPEDGGHGALLAFILGEQARIWSQRSADERRRAVVESLVRLFGAKAASPEHYVDKDWPSDPWSRGCYTGLFPPGVLTAYGEALRVPVGRIHWAGTETALQWNGYMDGAIESGERAAGEVLARLKAAA
jgi:monoamine oxidase